MKGIARLGMQVAKFSPSPELRENLIRHKLCSNYDLRLCRTEIRQLAHDLPIFDSLWLDALVRIGRLTPFQAEKINSHGMESLLVGDYVICDLLKHQQKNQEFLAKKLGSQRYVLNRFQVSEMVQAEHLEQLKGLKNKLQSISDKRCEKILEILEEKSALTIVSSHQPGLNLKELLIRRGRVKSSLVQEIARQLLLGMGELHRQHVVHGDLRLENVVLLRSGKVLIRGAGLRQMLSEHGERYLQRSPECYDGFAPELADVGNQPTYCSDFYSLGCLLWELLAGKPPFIAGDPLIKIQRHQQGKFPDIREIAPETNEAIADLINHLTMYQPHERPKNAEESLLKYLGSKSSWNMGLKTLAQRVCTTASRYDSPSLRLRFNPAFVLVPLIVLFAGGVFYLGDVGKKAQAVLASRWELLTSVEISKPANDQNVTNTEQSPATNVSIPGMNFPDGVSPVQETITTDQIPLADAQGKIVLTGGKTYSTSNLDYGQNLEISTQTAEPATIYLSGKPWNIKAPKITLRNIMLISSALGEGGKLQVDPVELPGLVNFHSGEIICQRVIWQGPNVASREVSVFNILQDPEHDLNHRGVSRLFLDQVGFTGAAHGIQFMAGGCAVELEDVLKTGRGSLLVNQVSEANSQQIQSIKLSHVTLREADHLLDIRGSAVGTHLPKYQIMAERNVWGLIAGHELCIYKASGNHGPSSVQQIKQQFSWVGTENLILPGMEFCLGVWGINQAGSRVRIYGLEPGEGFLQTNWTFNGTSLRKLDENVLRDYDGPKLSSTNPGFRLQKQTEPDW